MRWPRAMLTDCEALLLFLLLMLLLLLLLLLFLLFLLLLRSVPCCSGRLPDGQSAQAG